jgi:hypothetical protein
MTHLILHKVRGEPAFDVAEKIQIGDEEGWIIPTSGHRAYPYWTQPIEAVEYLGQSHIGVGGVFFGSMPPIPKDWPDHYQNEDTGHITSGVNVMAIVSKLLPKVKRRL